MSVARDQSYDRPAALATQDLERVCLSQVR